MKRLTSIIVMLLVLTTLLSACGPAASNSETTEATPMKNIYQKSDPAQDDTLNILMIGNSLCYYYVEELYGMLKAAGIKANVCNVYHSGCTVKQHWTWWKNGESNYDFYITNEEGRVKTEGTSLEYCLKQQNWDVISMQESNSAFYNGDPATQREASKVWRTELWSYIKEQFPMSRHLWHQQWSRQIGTTSSGSVMASAEQQQNYADLIRDYALAVCQEQDLERVNSGDAWQIVRKEHGYDKLCARIGKGENHEGDTAHDGDWGGGQYLNACVWFEITTGQSCIGNTYRPEYIAGGQDLSLSEELVQILQESAHKAVENRDTQTA